MANTIIDSAGLSPEGFDYAMGTGWIPYLLGMEELPGKEAFQRASVGTDLFKSLTDFMTNPTAGPLGLAATAAYGGPQGIAAGTGGKGLPELSGYQSNFDKMLNDLMGFAGTMNAQPGDSPYVPPKIDPNRAPAPTPEAAAAAPNVAQDWVNAWQAYNPGKKPPTPGGAAGTPAMKDGGKMDLNKDGSQKVPHPIDRMIEQSQTVTKAMKALGEVAHLHDADGDGVPDAQDSTPKGISKMAAGGSGVVVGGQPHFVVDANGNPVAAITEDGKPEQVTGTPDGFEVTPLDPARNAAYETSKREGSMGAALADADNYMAQMTRIPHAATGASLMLPSSSKPYVGDSQAHPSGVPVPTIGGPSMSREDQVGSFFKPQTGAGAPSLMEQIGNIGGTNYNEKYAKLIGGALSGNNMAVPADQLQALNAGRAPDNLFSAQALSTMSPSQRKGYANMLKQMGIVQSEEDLDYAVDQFRPAGLMKGGTKRLKKITGPENRANG